MPLPPTVATLADLAALPDVARVLASAANRERALTFVRDMVAAGELGEITGFRGIHAEDYMHDPESPYSWRIDPVGGPGVIADLGSHIIGMARL